MIDDVVNRWTAVESSELYEVARWGKDYFSVHADGHLLVHPHRNPNQSIDLKQLVDRLALRGLSLPVLIRFSGILDDRLTAIQDAFTRAIEDYNYGGKYSCVYPIKVNQQRQVVEEIVRFGKPYGFGLEAGSKPELLAVVAMTEADAPIVCNGFKDDEFVALAMWAQKMGRHVIPVVEKITDLQMILDHAQRLGVRPQIGVRAKLAAPGSGRWQSSAGYRSKFGLTVGEILTVLETLEERGMADCLKLLHFHLGSQVTNIRHIKRALTEAARIYSHLVQRGAGLDTIDVGGGLGIDYDGSQTNYPSSVNYSIQEYGNDVVYRIQSVCDQAGVPHPNIMSESGRAIVAYHSVLVFDVLGVTQRNVEPTPAPTRSSTQQSLKDLFDTLQELKPQNVLESFHDAQQALETTIELFSTGHITLEERAAAEDLFWTICGRTRQIVRDMEFVPDELATLDRFMCDTYFCNFSVFQSIPDNWAIKQLFPILPIHRLNEQPTRPAILADVTCDSDGKIDHFIDHRELKRTLPLHPPDGSPYLLGAFLVGAYQEILGDLHNLFGDTNAVHVDLNVDGDVVLNSTIKGDTVTEVLAYVGFSRNELTRRLQAAVEQAVQQGNLDYNEAGCCLKFYEEALNGYTYLEESEL